MANFNLTVRGVMGIGPGSRRIYEALMGGALLRRLCEDGPGGLLGLGALPQHCQVLSPYSAPLAVGTDYSDLSDADDDTVFTVWLVDSAATDSNPAPTFGAWCTESGGTYAHEAS